MASAQAPPSGRSATGHAAFWNVGRKVLIVERTVVRQPSERGIRPRRRLRFRLGGRSLDYSVRFSTRVSVSSLSVHVGRL